MEATTKDALYQAATTAQGLALESVINSILTSPRIFTFGEFLNLPNVVALGDANPHRKNLELFAYGTFSDAKKFQGTLTEDHIKKLRKLTLLSLGSKDHRLSYHRLKEALNFTRDAEVEQLLIEAMYDNIIEGRINQKEKVFKVTKANTRDLKPQEGGELIQALKDILANSTAVEASLREKITTLNKNKQEVSKSKEELTKLRQQISAKAVAAQEGQQNA